MTFPQFLPASRVPEPAEAPPLNWGVIGTGWIARQFIGPGYRSYLSKPYRPADLDRAIRQALGK